jgi:hypothetical protein
LAVLFLTEADLCRRKEPQIGQRERAKIPNYMLPIFDITDEMTSAAKMDISESFHPEDLAKTDFFDFVSAPPSEQEGNQATQNNSNSNNDQPLQGFDQVSRSTSFNPPETPP